MNATSIMLAALNFQKESITIISPMKLFREVTLSTFSYEKRLSFIVSIFYTADFLSLLTDLVPCDM